MSNQNPELPNGWEWRGGNRGQTYYDVFFGTEYYMGGPYAGDYGLGGMNGQIYWDKGQSHVVEICPVTSMDGDDPVLGYAEIVEEFQTEEEAHNAVPELIKEL
jgi:hypothetical protein